MKKRKVIAWLIILTLILGFVVPQKVSASTGGVLGGKTTTGDLKITVDEGNINVERFNGSVFDRQYYAPADAVLDINGTLYSLGTYFKDFTGDLQSLSVTSQTADSKKITTKWSTDTFEITQIVTLPNEDAQYIRLQWSVKNLGNSVLANIHFLRGEDTYLAGGDNGAGFWDENMNSIGVSKVVNGSTQRLFMQGMTIPNSYVSADYRIVSADVADGGTLSKTIDSNVGTDNGYALEWYKETLTSNSIWTINAIESFVSAKVIGSGGTTTGGFEPGEPSVLRYTITNTSDQPQVLTYTYTGPEGWEVVLEREEDELLPGESTTVDIFVTPPEHADPGAYDIVLNISDGTAESQAIGTVVINDDSNEGETASGAEVTLIPLNPPAEGVVTLSVVTSGAIEANTAVYYRVVSSQPEAMNVGDIIDTEEWNLMTDLDGRDILVPDGYYVEAVVVTSDDNKVVNWGVSEASSDGYDSSVVTGSAITVSPLITPESGKVLLTVSPEYITEGYNYYYRVVNSEPEEINTGDILDVSGWLKYENLGGQIIDAPDGSYVELVKFNPEDFSVTSWWASSATNDGYNETEQAGGLTVTVNTDSSNPENHTLSVYSDGLTEGNKLYYRVVNSNPASINTGDIIDVSEWTEITDRNGQQINVPEGSYVEVVEVDPIDNGITLWGKSSAVSVEIPTEASGIIVNITPKSTPNSGKVILSVDAGSLGSGTKLYYRVVTSSPTPLNTGDIINIGSWIEITNPSGQEISAADGSYIEVVAVNEENKVLFWGTSGRSDDGYTTNSGNNISTSGSSNTTGSTRQSEVKAEDETNGTKTANVNIVRTADKSKKIDSVILDSVTTQEVLKYISGNSDKKVTIVIDDIESDPADEVMVTVKKDSLSQLKNSGAALVIQTEYGSIIISADSINSLSENGEDLYFRVVPVKAETDKNTAITNAITSQIVTNTAQGKEVSVYAAPMTIETNYKDLPTTLKLSLKDVVIPADAKERDELLSKLAVFIKHSDGDEELSRGTIIYDSKGKPTDIQIELTKFSTFTIIGFDNVAPSVSNLKISGTAKVGNTIKGSYVYSDFDKDKEGKSIIKWYRADSVKGKNKTSITGAVSLSYKVTKKDQGKYLIFEITPVSLNGSSKGDAVSGSVYVNAAASNSTGSAPAASKVKISGSAVVGGKLTASYTYTAADKEKQGKSIFQWYRADNAGGKNKTAVKGATGTTYTLTSADKDKYVFFSITPVTNSGEKGEKVTVGLKTAVTEKAVTYKTVLKLGLIGSKSYAEKIAGILEKKYGGAEVQVTKEGNYYRVTARFVTKAIAKAAAEEMKADKYIINFYINQN